MHEQDIEVIFQLWMESFAIGLQLEIWHAKISLLIS